MKIGLSFVFQKAWFFEDNNLALLIYNLKLENDFFHNFRSSFLLLLPHGLRKLRHLPPHVIVA